MRGGLVEHVARFGRMLRGAGLDIGTDALLDSARALHYVGIERRDDVKAALATVLLNTVGQQELFDELFDAFWGSPFMSGNPDAVGSGIDLHQQPGGSQLPDAESSPDRGPSGWTTILPDDTPADSAADQATTFAAYSPHTLWQRDFADIGISELPDLRRLAASVARRLATRYSRRTEPVRGAGRIDQRRTLRLALRHGGDTWKLQRKRRTIRRSRLVVLCDVSGSMTVYARILLVFAYALQQVAGGHKVETFTFGTDLERVTPVLNRAQAEQAVTEAKRVGGHWAGGTRIGQSLRTFRRQFAQPLLNRDTTLIVLSDGLDTGEVDTLQEQMQWVRQRVGKIIWLNPLAGDHRYQPLAAGMAAALPYIDVLASAHNLASLSVLERYI